MSLHEYVIRYMGPERVGNDLRASACEFEETFIKPQTTIMVEKYQELLTLQQMTVVKKFIKEASWMKIFQFIREHDQSHAPYRVTETHFTLEAGKKCLERMNLGEYVNDITTQLEIQPSP